MIYNYCNMKFFISAVCILLSTLAFGQKPETFDKLETAKIALITERLELTPEQAEKFWPLYREYTDRQQELRREFMVARKQIKTDGMTDEESKKLVDKGLELKEKRVALDRDYADKFTRVITARQLLQLRKAEDDFKEMVLQRIEKRQEVRKEIRQDRLDRREDRKNNE